MPGVRVRAHRASFNYDNQEGDGLQTGISTFAGELWQAAGVRPDDIDVASIYDDYPTMVLAQANDLGLIPGNDLARFAAATSANGDSRSIPGAACCRPASRAARPAASTAFPRRCCNCSIAPASGR